MPSRRCTYCDEGNEEEKDAAARTVIHVMFRSCLSTENGCHKEKEDDEVDEDDMCTHICNFIFVSEKYMLF